MTNTERRPRDRHRRSHRRTVERNATGERADILETLRTHRYFLRHTVAGPDRRAGRPAPDGQRADCLGGLIKHVAATESGWVDFIARGPEAMASRGESTRTELAQTGQRVPDAARRDPGRGPRRLRASRRPAPTSWSRRSPTSTCRTRSRRPRGSRPARPARRGACSCTSSPRPPSTPATPTSSARPSTARRRWAEHPPGASPAPGGPGTRGRSVAGLGRSAPAAPPCTPCSLCTNGSRCARTRRRLRTSQPPGSPARRGPPAG